MSEYRDRLKQFLNERQQPLDVESLTADASIREYFRIGWNGGNAIACVYPESFSPAEQSYLEVTNLFTAAGLPVAEILDFDGDLGVIIQEDLGDRILRDAMIEAEKPAEARLRDEAISLIARIQAATDKAFEMNSIASRLKFDREKLVWELNFFKTHYFETFLKKPLSAAEDAALSTEFVELATELESFATVLCHRDFHAANLMIDGQDRMRIIDHQDARIGSPAYDLVSLLLDRITYLPSRQVLAESRKSFLDFRTKMVLARRYEAPFAYQFRFQPNQRCLQSETTIA